jgi:hypothetical protein
VVVERTPSVSTEVHSRHRPIDAYSRALEAAGFVIEAIREHPVADEAIESDQSKRWQRIPLFLHFRVRRDRAAGHRLPATG